jgi:Flavin containing amine oxidoreductase
VVTTQAGDAFSASATVVALPLNVLKRVDFSPKLGEEKRIASEEEHTGHSVKGWALVEAAPPSFEDVGHGPKRIEVDRHRARAPRGKPDGRIRVRSRGAGREKRL